MRAVFVTNEEGQTILEFNWMWMPTFIGMNTVLREELGKALSRRVVGLPLTEVNLDKIDNMVREYLIGKFKHVKGLDTYLDALKYIEEA